MRPSMSSDDVPFDKSGIYSQAGFAFQMKVFLHYASKLQPGDSLSYEYLDDIVAQPEVNEMAGVLKAGPSLIQAKRKKLSETEVTRLYINWVDTFRENQRIEEFVLVQNYEQAVHESFEQMDSEEFVEKVHKLSDGHERSAAAKLVKAMHDSGIASCFTDVQSRSRCSPIGDVADLIGRDFQQPFHYTAVSADTYRGRLEELQGRIEFAILESMLAHEPYTIDQTGMMRLYEDICQEITDSRYKPSFNAWRAHNPGEDYEMLASRRDVRQLNYCFKDISRIMRHIYYGEYYSSLRFRRLENCQSSHIDDLEGVTYENYEMACDDLRGTERDSPCARLNNTKREPNSHCFNDEEKWGSCIFLTSDRAPVSRLISWKDDAR